jgi:DNA mismatch repair ATPase MutS
MYNDIIAKMADPNSMAKQSQYFQSIISDKDYFKSLKGAQNEVIKLVLSEYKEAIPLKLCELFQQKIQEKPPVNKAEDVNKPEEIVPKN